MAVFAAGLERGEKPVRQHAFVTCFLQDFTVIINFPI
jgi:hypothetical protein